MALISLINRLRRRRRMEPWLIDSANTDWKPRIIAAAPDGDATPDDGYARDAYDSA